MTTAALAALHANRLAEAERLYRKTLRTQPDNADALHGLGIVQLRQKQPARALFFFERALRAGSPSIVLHSNHGIALTELGRPEEALASLDRALAAAPESAALHYNRGNALMALLRHEAALGSFTRAVTLDPGLRPAWQNKAVIEHRLGLAEAALATCDHLLALFPGAGLPAVRGEALLALQLPAEALSDLAAVVHVHGDVQSRVNEAYALDAAGRSGEAVDAIDAALRADPEYVMAHWNAASICLSMGDFARGWPEFEWRWLKPEFQARARPFRQPLWLGREDIAGKTILLHAEQGMGDTLQFCRYVPMVAARGARVVLEAYPPLRALFATLAGADMLIERGDRLPTFDLHCPLMSLPLAFGTDVSTIPAQIPYLAADPARVAAWRRRLGPATRPRIGLAWSGSASHTGDSIRSAPLAALAPLIRPDYAYYSVQKDVRAGDEATAAALGITMTGADVADFADAAALVSCLDLVISVDSAPAHLAGAIGHPLWVLLPHAAEWRWLRHRDDTPWYPGAKLFRQARAQDWTELAQRVGDCLHTEWSTRT